MVKYLNLLVLLLLLQNCFAQTESKALQATFGRYGSNCSSGRGACSFNIQDFEFSKNIVKIITKRVNENAFVVEIIRSKLTLEDEIRIAGKSINDIKNNENPDFVQIDPLILSEASLKALDINPKYNTISKGNYPMEIYKDKIKIVFTLKATD